MLSYQNGAAHNSGHNSNGSHHGERRSLLQKEAIEHVASLPDARTVRAAARVRQRRLRISFAIILLFVGVLIAMVCNHVRHQDLAPSRQFRSHHHRHHQDKSSNSNDDDGGASTANNDDEWREQAAQALHRLNHHHHQQAQVVPPACTATVLLVRHCEKHGPDLPLDDGADSHNNPTQHCSYMGTQRAHYLATLFGTRWPWPDHLYALSPARAGHVNFREWETLYPTWQKVVAAVAAATQTDNDDNSTMTDNSTTNNNTNFTTTSTKIQIVTPDTLPDRIFAALQAGEAACQTLTVVSWKHDLLPTLARSLGCGPDQGCPSSYDPDEYDVVWHLQYVFRPPLVDAPMLQAAAAAWSDYQQQESPPLPPPHHRALHHYRDTSFDADGWNVFGTTTRQYFDPLAFAFSSDGALA